MSATALLARRLHGSAASATAAKPARATPAARAAVPGYLQTRLRLSQPGDALEQEAERAAEAVAHDAAPDVKPAATATLARSAAGDGALSPAIEQRIEASRGHGQPLAPAVRADMESRFGSDFGDVRTHTGAEAAELSRALDAQAFTSGSDVFFDSGRYAPAAPAGRALLAHELTHVVQQGDSPAAARQVQRAKGDGDAGKTAAAGAKTTDATTSIAATGNGELVGGQVVVPELNLPKKPNMATPAPFTVAKNADLKEMRSSRQVQKWESARKNSASGWSSKLKAKRESAKNTNVLPDPPNGKKGAARYLFKVGALDSWVIGDDASIPGKLLRPWWDRSGSKKVFAVDHILELQLGGQDEDTNYQLLETGANSRAGELIFDAVDAAIDAALPPKNLPAAEVPEALRKLPPKEERKDDAAAPAASAAPSPTPSAAPAGTAANTGAPAGKKKEVSARKKATVALRRQYDIVFTTVKAAANPATTGPFWKKTDIDAGEHVDTLKPASAAEVKSMFGEGKVQVFPQPLAGSPLTITDGKAAAKKWGQFEILSLNHANGTGSITLALETKNAKGEPFAIRIIGDADDPRLATLERASGHLPRIKAKLLSDIVTDNFDFDENMGASGSGELTVDGIDLVKGAKFAVELVDGEPVFTASFSPEEVKIPGPVKITACSFMLRAGGGDVGASGQVQLALGEFAACTLSASGSARTGLSLTGQLDISKSDLFDGSGRVTYTRSASGEGKLSADASLTIRKKLPGLKKATLRLGVSPEGALTFGGSGELTIPGFESASFNLSADEKGDIHLSAKLAYAGKSKVVKRGELTVEISRSGDDYDLAGKGWLEPDLSGVDASARLELGYAKGLLTGRLDAQYTKKVVAGKLTLNAKAGVGDNDEPLKVWGSGSVDFKAAPWLKATVGLTLGEDGSLTVAGKLGIPAPVELFPKKEYKKQILPLAAPSIPIFGFAVAGVNVGVFLNIDGSLDFIASFGPGQLTEASVGITWSPDDEDATELDGKATFVIPAYAGLKLTVDAGLGVGAAVISAIGGLSVWGELGVQASAGLGVDLKWKPGLGIKLNGEAKADAEAVLKLGAGGFIKVVAKIIGTIYEERFPAGEFTLGSGLKIGVTLPVSYEPDKSFELDFSKIDIRTPEISAGDLVDKIKDQLPSP